MNMKIVIFLVFMFIGTIMGANDNATCYACGPECAHACGTKRFRFCCYNYYRRNSRGIKLQDLDQD